MTVLKESSRQLTTLSNSLEEAWHFCFGLVTILDPKTLYLGINLGLIFGLGLTDRVARRTGKPGGEWSETLVPRPASVRETSGTNSNILAGAVLDQRRFLGQARTHPYQPGKNKAA